MRNTNHNDNIKKIHVGKTKLGMDDDLYRDFLFGLTGKRSSKEMNQREQIIVLAKMNTMGAFTRPRLTRQQKKALALWNHLKKLGVIDVATVRTLNVFLKNKKFEAIGRPNFYKLGHYQANALVTMLENIVIKHDKEYKRQ